MTTRKTMTVALLAGCLGLAVRAETPDFIADTLRSDGVGYIDLGYKLKGATYPKTAKIGLDYSTADCAFGTPPGPVTTATMPAVFGCDKQAASDFLGVRYSSKSLAYIYHPGGNVKVRSGLTGDVSLRFDFLAPSAYWGTAEVTGFVMDAMRNMWFFGMTPPFSSRTPSAS